MNWDQSFKEYAIQIARIYKNNPAQIISCLSFGSVSGCLNETYLSLVRSKDLPPVEMLENDQKMQLWKQAKEITENQRQRIEVSRSIYLLNELTRIV